MNLRNRTNLISALVLGAVFSLVTAGCGHHASNEAINQTDNHLAAADAYVVSAQPHTSKVGKPMLENARTEIKAAGESNQRANLAFIALEVVYAHLKGKWYVWLGQWIERLFWLIVGSWALSGVFGVVAGGGLLGAGKLYKIGRFILGLHHAAPLPNPWSPLANRIKDSREVGV